MSYPKIRHEGAEVQVTPDTARDLIDCGLATLVEGEVLPPPAKAQPEDQVEDVPAEKVTNVPKTKKTTRKRSSRGTKASAE